MKASKEELAILEWETRRDPEDNKPLGWWSAARPEQLPKPGNWTYWLILAGRGWGKTRTGCEWIKHMVDSGYKRGAIVAKDPGEAREVIIEGESGIMAICPPHARPLYEPSKKRLTWPNGSIHSIYSSEEFEELRGPQHDHALVDELAKYRTASDTWDQLMFGMRLGKHPQIAITTTPRPIPVIKQILADPATIITKGTTYDNLGNLTETYRQIIRKYEGTRLGRQELNADILDDNPNALWSWSMIENHRVVAMPPGVEIRRVVVGLDPSVKEEGTEAGIIVACRGSNDHYYVLVDSTTRGRPEKWGRAAVNALNHWQGDRIVAEINNGGAMVEDTIRRFGGDRVPVKLVTASRGKLTRAEPISALYEQGLVHHVGTFPELEDEMTTYDALTVKESPNRMDALVWALTELSDRTPVDMGEAEIMQPRVTHSEAYPPY